MVRQIRLGNLLANREYRIQRALRFLKDHPDLPSAHRTHLRIAQPRQIAPLKEHLPLRNERRRHRQQAHDRITGDGLAAPRFAHERHALALFDIKRNPIHRPSHAGIGLEMGV